LWGALTKVWVPPDVRDLVVDFVRCSSEKAEIGTGRFIHWLGALLESSAVFGNPLVVGPFPRGTLCAGIGLIIIAAYYLRAWHGLRGRSASSLTPYTSVSPGSQPWPELRYLQYGMLASVLFFVLAGAADAPNDWLDRLVGCLMGFCAALGAGMFGVGFVSLANLWKELALELKKAKIGSLLFSIPLAVLWLALGVGLFVLLGMFVEKIPESRKSLFEALLLSLISATFVGLLWHLISVAFHSLWSGKSHAALMLRLILMVSFSAIIVAALAFGFWWITLRTAPLLVIFLSAIGSLDVLFYSHWVRLAAVEDNLE
jgi:hypothetical protein